MRYRLVLECDINGDGKTELIEFDNCNSKDVDSSSRLPEHPLQNGSILIDHSYREPNKMSVSGVYSLNGYYTMQKGINDPYKNLSLITSEESTKFNFNNDELYGVNRLGYIQNVIEYIKNNGILCTLTTMADGDGGIMFKRRENMAIESIHWKEKYNAMDFTIGFKEIIQVVIPQYETTAYSDLYPEVYMPEAQSLTQVISNGDNNIIARAVMQKLLDEGYIDEKNKKYMQLRGKDFFINFGATYAALAAVATAVAIIIGAVAATVAATGTAAAVIGSCAAIFPVGTIIAAAAAAIGACVWAAITIKKNAKKRNNLYGAYNLIKDTNAEMSELNLNVDNVNKVNALLENVTEILATKLSNDVTLYTLSSGTDNNNDRTICLTISDNIYYFQAFKNNDNWQFTLQQKNDTSETTQVSRANFSVSDLWSATQSNALFVDYKNGIEVYVINPSLTTSINQSTEEQEAAKKYLCGYYLLISKGKLEDTMKNLNNAILDATVTAFEGITV